MTGFVEVVSPGLYSSIQDLGRFGARKYGVPVSGAMDGQGAALANHLLNNAPGAALLEITMMGPKLFFTAPAQIAIAGADISPQLDGLPLALNKVHSVGTGALLSFGALRLGLRCYLAVKGGFQTEKVMGSRSYFAPVTRAGTLGKGDKLPFTVYNRQENLFTTVGINPLHFSASGLPCTRGPEFDWLSPGERDLVFNTALSIGKDNNRMGYRLEGHAFQYPNGYSMLTSCVLPGTVQLTPSGGLIVLMKDCQTTGGYPRVLQLSPEGINRLAQKKAADIVTFDRPAKG